MGGGAYFRLMPLTMFTMGVRSILKKEAAYVFYMHPWEIDAGQPKVEQASRFSRFKHYKNIETTEAKLEMLIESFADCRFAACKDYVTDGARRKESVESIEFVGIDYFRCRYRKVRGIGLARMSTSDVFKF